MESQKSGVKTGGWYYKLLDQVNDLVRKFDLPGDIAGDIQRLTIEVARAQFKAGNNSGISWLRRKQEEKLMGASSPAAA